MLQVYKKDELKEYEAEELEPSNCDPDGILLYWAQRSHKCPRLSCMARDILTITATSASSESVHRRERCFLYIKKESQP
jgi:hypothetical protein